MYTEHALLNMIFYSYNLDFSNFSFASPSNATHDHGSSTQNPELYGFRLISDRELLVPDFIVSRKGNVEVWASLTLDHCVDLTEEEIEELAEIHNFLVFTVGNDLGSRVPTKRSAGDEQGDHNGAEIEDKHHSNSSSSSSNNNEQENSKHSIFILPKFPSTTISDAASASKTTTTTATTIRTVQGEEVPLLLGAGSLHLDLIKTYFAPPSNGKQSIYHMLNAWCQDLGAGITPKELRRILVDKYNNEYHLVQDLEERDEEFRRAVAVGEEINKRARGLTVMTPYNRQLYNIECIDFIKTRFDRMYGTDKTFQQYYKERWGLQDNNSADNAEESEFIPMVKVRYARNGSLKYTPKVTPLRAALQRRFDSFRPKHEEHSAISSEDGNQQQQQQQQQQDSAKSVSSKTLKDSSSSSNNNFAASQHPQIFLLPELCHQPQFSVKIFHYMRNILLPTYRHIIGVQNHYAKLRVLEDRLGFKMHNPLLLRQAFTHPSYVGNFQHVRTSNQRLETIGDAVLGVVISEHLLSIFPSNHDVIPLGLSRVIFVGNLFLVSAASKLDLTEYMLAPPNMKAAVVDSARKVKADLLEALIGAIFVDQGFEAAQRFIARTVLPQIDALLPKFTLLKASTTETTASSPIQEMNNNNNNEGTPLECGSSKWRDRVATLEARYGFKLSDTIKEELRDSLLVLTALHQKQHTPLDVASVLSPELIAQIRPYFNVTKYCDKRKKTPWCLSRLEFLGDALMKFLITAHLFFKYPEASEEKLTLMTHHLMQVSVSVSKAAAALQLEDLLLATTTTYAEYYSRSCSSSSTTTTNDDNDIHHGSNNEVAAEASDYAMICVGQAFKCLVSSLYLNNKANGDGSGSGSGSSGFVYRAGADHREPDVQGEIMRRFFFDIVAAESNLINIDTPIKHQLQHQVQVMTGALPVWKEMDNSSSSSSSNNNNNGGGSESIQQSPLRVGVYVDNVLLAVGEGLMLKQAENDAASKALKLLSGMPQTRVQQLDEWKKQVCELRDQAYR